MSDKVVTFGKHSYQVGNRTSAGAIMPNKANCGVFGREITDDYVIRAGDRLEIYRPLERDPRDARRELAARGLTM